MVQACTLKQRLTGSPWPCLAVDRQGGFAVVPDPKRRRIQVLVTPTVRVTGIEDPQLLSPASPNLWRAAWAARSWLDRRVGNPLADEKVGLAVNSLASRTQDLLHIHVGCLRPAVRRAVDAHIKDVGESWTELCVPLRKGHRYRARWLARDALQATDLFRLLAADPAVNPDRSAWTLVMVAAHRRLGDAGFVLLSHKAEPATGDFAAGEELLDHRWPTARTPSRRKAVGAARVGATRPAARPQGNAKV